MVPIPAHAPKTGIAALNAADIAATMVRVRFKDFCLRSVEFIYICIYFYNLRYFNNYLPRPLSLAGHFFYPRKQIAGRRTRAQEDEEGPTRDDERHNNRVTVYLVLSNPLTPPLHPP